MYGQRTNVRQQQRCIYLLRDSEMVNGDTFGNLYNFYLGILFLYLFFTKLSIDSYIFIFKVNVWLTFSILSLSFGLIDITKIIASR